MMTLDKSRVLSGKPTMKAVVTRGNGGFEQLDYCDMPIPELGAGEVLIQVLAAGVNNTEINTRLGWYSESVSTSTLDMNADESQKSEAKEQANGGWNEATPFPFIQGTDCCGRVVATFSEDDKKLLGKRILIRACMRSEGWGSLENIWMASDFDGAFAQFVKVPASEVFSIETDWTDEELGSIPCAYGTAESMIHRCKVSEQDHVLIPGGSGGVGSALIQLCKRRGAKVTSIVSKEKQEKVLAIGADAVLDRGEDIVAELGENSITIVIDNVGGDNFPNMLKVLKRGGSYASSGAIAGPVVTLDMRTLYLKDITLIGCTAWDQPVFPNLIGYIEKNEIRPLIAKTFQLNQIVEAQKEFLLKKHVGKLVLIPPALTAEQRDFIADLNK
ncbi:MAG: NADPH:quinone reductase-like Zn-dependent oxidoreductase [Bacteroidia bacterium]|jgi:NADPH:quinone reductase-like Zn-dependent oxidoreductase